MKNEEIHSKQGHNALLFSPHNARPLLLFDRGGDA